MKYSKSILFTTLIFIIAFPYFKSTIFSANQNSSMPINMPVISKNGGKEIKIQFIRHGTVVLIVGGL